jgi:hypothetical protein
VQETENGPPKVVTGAIVGEANLYDVIFYGNKNSFVKDKDKHFAGSNYEKPICGFLVNHAKRFDIPIPISGKLGFFNVELNGIQTLSN